MNLGIILHVRINLILRKSIPPQGRMVSMKNPRRLIQGIKETRFPLCLPQFGFISHSLHCRCSLFHLPNHFLQFLGLFLVLNFITLSASIFCCSSFPYLQLSIYVLMNVIFLLLGWKLIYVMPCFSFSFSFFNSICDKSYKCLF